MALAISDIDTSQVVRYADLRGWWLLDSDSAGDTCIDLSGNGHDGTPSGAGGAYNKPQPTLGAPSPISGIVSGCLDFDGTDDIVTISDHVDFRFGTGDFSAFSWVRPDSVTYGSTDSGNILSKHFTGWSFHIYQAGLTGYIGGTQNLLAAGSGTVSAGNWYHIGITRIGSACSLYLNAAVIATATNSAAADGVGYDLLLGNRPGSTFHLNGRMSDARVWSIGLSLSEVADVYAGDIAEASGVTSRRRRSQTRSHAL